MILITSFLASVQCTLSKLVSFIFFRRLFKEFLLTVNVIQGAPKIVMTGIFGWKEVEQAVNHKRAKL